MLANRLKKASEQGNMDGSIMMLVQEYFRNCILRSSVDEAISFVENYSIVVFKPYGSWWLFLYGLAMFECL